VAVKNFNEIKWEKTNYGRRKTLITPQEGVNLTIRYVEVEDTVRPHQHPNGEVLFVLEGEGKFHCKGKTIKIGEGSIIVIPPETIQHIERTSIKTLKMIAIFPGEP